MPPSGPETIKDIIDYLYPDALLGTEPYWPPDAFAIAATILKRSGAYRDVANSWPPSEFSNTDAWHSEILAIADEWRDLCDKSSTMMPVRVNDWWELLIQSQALRLSEIIQNRDLVIALVGIVAACDCACAGFGFKDFARIPTTKEDRANANLSASKSLCENIHPSRCAVLPKAHNPFTGMTLRSLTHNVAIWDKPEVSASWENIRLDIPKQMNMLLVPWPLVVDQGAFHKASDSSDLRLPNRVGLFDYDIGFKDSDVEKVEQLIKSATAKVGDIHGVVFPELAMAPKHFSDLRKRVQDKLKIPLMISGIGGANADRLGTNNVAISVYSELDQPYLQGKHHRWRLDATQADSYGIKALPPKPENGAWWEGIEIENRSCSFFNANDWLTFCVLICEDLARQDPVSELVRAVGPSLVIALLLDGPQVKGRWPDRYATVLAEDPRSSVLTLTCAGLVDLANKNYVGAGKRSIALWRQAESGSSQEVLLDSGNEAVVLRLESKMSKEWTADGRHDDGKTGYLALLDTVQIKV